MSTQCTDDDGSNIKKGQAVCLTGWDTVPMVPRPKVKRATNANLSTFKTVYGVAEADTVAGVVTVRVSGDMADQSITGLATAAGGGPPTGTLVLTDFYSTGGAAFECKLRHIY